MRLPAFAAAFALAAVPLVAAESASAEIALTVPAERPAVAKFSIKSLQGKRFQSKKLKGNVVVVNFWATWCAPCMQELPFLDELQTKYKKKGLTVMAISNDGPETAAKVSTVIKRRKWKMPTFHDRSGQLVASLNPRGGNPYTLFIDRQGRVAFAHEGYTPGDEKKYEVLIQQLLAEKK